MKYNGLRKLFLSLGHGLVLGVKSLENLNVSFEFIRNNTKLAMLTRKAYMGDSRSISAKKIMPTDD